MNRNLRYLRTILRSDQRRHVLSWLLSLRPNYFLDTPSAWLTFDAIAYLKKWLSAHPNAYVFEYGSGGSTLFWLAHGCRCVSVEHDQQWYELVKQRLHNVEPSRIDYRLIVPVPADKSADQLDAANPLDYTSRDQTWRGYSFKSYATQINAFAEDTFDLVLVDGRARPSCIYHSVNKVKTGGLLVVDNSDNPYYLEQTRHLLTNFTLTRFYGVGPRSSLMWQTDIYRKN